MKSFVFWCETLVALDQLIKFTLFNSVLAEKIFRFRDTGIFGIKLFENAQFAFSLPLPQPAIYLIYIFVLSLISIYLVKHFNALTKQEYFAWLIIFAGAISNAVERIFRGSVRDYLFINGIGGGGILNLADLYIIGGIVALFYLEIKLKIFKKN